MGTAMTRYGQIGWRLAAIAAFVGTAVLAIGLTRAPARSDASLSYGLPGRACPTSGLEAWLGLGAASAATAARPGSAGPPEAGDARARGHGARRAAGRRRHQAGRLRRGDRRGTPDHAAAAGPALVRGHAHPGVLAARTRVPERAGHPGAAGHPGL